MQRRMSNRHVMNSHTISLKTKFLLVLAIVGINVFLPCAVSADPLEVGDPAPDLMGVEIHSGRRVNLYRLMTDHSFQKEKNGRLTIGADGKYVSLFRRNVLVLNFFSRFCIPCIREIPAYQRVARKFKDRPVKMLFVNTDGDISLAALQAIAEKRAITLPVLYVNQQEVMRTYQPRALPKLLVIGKDRKVVRILTGFREDFETVLTGIVRELL